MKYILTITFIIASSYSVHSQNLNLKKTILEMDSLIFHEAFNKCNFNNISTLLSEDFEFYHDQHGITYGKQNFIASIKNNICLIPYRPRRELVKGSNLIYPLYNGGEIYGAIQNGVHKFYANEEGREEYFTSVADFSHLWIIENDSLKLKRVFSYNHQSTISVNSSNEDWKREHVESWLKDINVPCLGLGLIREGKLTDIQVYGELKKGAKAPYNTIFNVASLTKPIISMAVLVLVENDKWDLDEPLYKYWIDPDVKNDPYHKLLTTRHIFNHETGFLNWRSWHESKKLTFDFKPGTDFNYSGEGFEYLKKALENKFGQSLEEIVEEIIFQPLEMRDTKFKWDSVTSEDRFAMWHNSKAENEYKDFKIYEPSAADNLLTTIEDYGKFVTWVINGAELSGKLFKEMIITNEINGTNSIMGLGWEVHHDVGNEYALIHNGVDRGVHCVTILFPASKEGIVIMTNSDNGNQVYQKCVTDKLKLGKILWERGK